MHQNRILVAACLAGSLLAGSAATAAIKKVPYPEVKVTIEDRYQPDAAFQAMQKSFADAVTAKDAAALAAQVAPTFIWMLAGSPTAEMDLGRDAVHNFKVAFGFRAVGKDQDGGVDDGPYWDALGDFAADKTYYRASEVGDFICGPLGASVESDETYAQANDKLQNGDDVPEWYFTVAETAVSKAPDGKGPPVGKVAKVALPVLSSYPAAKPGQPETPATHYEVLLPSGKSGFVPVTALRPLFSDRLCYSKTPQGAWKISAYDQNPQ